jgi:hypothetical protein
MTESISKVWTWGYWASPLMYAQNALVVNEFLGHKWKHVSDCVSSYISLHVPAFFFSLNVTACAITKTNHSLAFDSQPKLFSSLVD